MPHEWGVAAVGVAGAVIGGFVGGVVGGVTPQLVAWYFQPQLKIDYQNDGEDNIVTVENTSSADNIWVRARVQNTGRLRAKECQVFLTSLHEVRADGLFPVLKDSKALHWTGRSKAPLDVPPGVEFYVDLLKLSKDVSGWGICGLFKHQQHLQSYSGTYHFCLMISADNAPPRRCAINVEYKQDWNTLRAWQVHP